MSDEFSPPTDDEAPLELDAPAGFRSSDVPDEEDQEDREDARRPGRSSGTAPPGRPRRLHKVLAVLVLLLVAVEVSATLIQHGSAPREAHWRAAASKLAAVREKGEPVLFAPAWVEPIGRLHMGDQIDLELLLLSDVDRYRRVFEVSVRGERHPWLQGERPKQEWELGQVRVALYERASPAEVVYDFTRRIAEAQVAMIGREVRRCGWEAARNRFACDPARGWNWVGPHLAEVGHRPYRCIYAHAVDGHVVRITFPAAVVGRNLVAYTGIDDFENRKRSDVSVVLKIFIGPKQLYVIRHQNRWGWRRFAVDTKAFAGQTHPVSFEVSTPAAFARTFCFSAETRK